MNVNEPMGPTSIELANLLVKEPYAWPGGYPRYALMMDGGALCVACCKSEAKRIADVDPNCPDDHCNNDIESAYGGDE